MQALLAALCAGAMLCTLGYLGTLRLEGKAPLWTLGTGYPIGGPFDCFEAEPGLLGRDCLPTGGASSRPLPPSLLYRY